MRITISIILAALATFGALLFGHLGEEKVTGPEKVSVDFSKSDIFTTKQVEIYDGIKVSSLAEKVDVSGRGLTGSLKAEVRQLNNLKELDLSDNKFTGLPAEVGQLSHLQVLNLSNNPLTGLPYELSNLSNLKTLDLRGTNYSQTDLNIIRQGLSNSVQILVD